MKKSLNHLPKNKQSELKKIVSAIRMNCNDVEKIILFGSYARGDYKEEKDLKLNRKSGHVSDYDILVVTSQKEVALDSVLWSNISEICKKLNPSASPRIITHDIKALNKKLNEGQYFYSDIKKEGIVIYDLGKFELAGKAKLTGTERQRVAQEHFDEWFLSAEEFFEGFLFYLERNSFKKAAFLLHQVAESAYKTTNLVFSNYCPNEHFLEILGKMSEKLHPKLKNLFSRETEEQNNRFKLLEYAYIGGRYDPNYKISKTELKALAKDVKKLLQVTEKICKEKISEFAKQNPPKIPAPKLKQK